MIRIFIVEDHPIMRQSIRALLEREDDLVVADEAATAEQALNQIGDAMPDLVLLDVSLPGMSGIELAETLRATHPQLPLVVLSGHGERSHVDQALAAGVQGYVLKGNGSELPTAIRQIVDGQRYLSPGIGATGRI